MSKINSNTKDDFQVVLLLSCFVGHPVLSLWFFLQNISLMNVAPQEVSYTKPFQHKIFPATLIILDLFSIWRTPLRLRRPSKSSWESLIKLSTDSSKKFLLVRTLYVEMYSLNLMV